jgi:hypothetical protein
MKIEYLTAYLSIILFVLYYHHLFFRYFNQPVIATAIIINSLIVLPVIFTPAEFYTRTLMVFEIMAGIIFIYCIIIVVQALRKKEEGALEVFTGSMILVLTIVNDVLSSLYILNTPLMLPFGFLIFIMIQSVLNFNRINNEMKKSRQLYEKTLMLNQQLEHEIEEKNILQNEVIRVNEKLENTVLLRTNELQKKNNELNKALTEIKSLSGMLPICSSCKKIRDDSGYWEQLETFISKHSDAQFSHSLCPDCYQSHYGDKNSSSGNNGNS